MELIVRWQDSMRFEGVVDGHTILMDAKAPIGKGSAPTPKELVAFGLGGCTAMDVIALLKKHKQPPDSFQVEVAIVSSEGRQPAVFVDAVLVYRVTGNVDVPTLLKAVELSQTQYCGVSAMLSKAFPITYRVVLNESVVGEGQANF